jgi:hypothetical protein
MIKPFSVFLISILFGSLLETSGDLSFYPLTLRYASEDGFVQIFPVISFKCRMARAALIKCVYGVDPLSVRSAAVR